MHTRKTRAGKLKVSSISEAAVLHIQMGGIAAETGSSAFGSGPATGAARTLEEDFEWGRLRRLPKKE
jgi:hypothetical protein